MIFISRNCGIVVVLLVLCGWLLPALAQAEPSGGSADLIQLKDKSKVDPKLVQPVLPATLNIVSAQPGTKNSSVALHQVKYNGTTAFGRPVSGTADLALTLVGHPLPVLKNQKFTGTVLDKSGKNSGFHISLGEDLVAKRFLGGKIDLILEKGSYIVADVTPKGGLAPYKFKGSVRIHLPYATESGKPVEIALGKGAGRKAVEIALATSAFTLAEQKIDIPATTLLVDGFKFVGVKAIGNFRLQVHPQQQSKPYDLETTLDKTKIIAYLPRFLLKEGFTVYAPQVKLEGGTPANGGGIPDDGFSTFTAATVASEPAKLDFIRPAGFAMEKCKSISLKVVKGDYIEAIVDGTLLLPKNFSQLVGDPKNGCWDHLSASRVEIATKLTYHTGKLRPYWSTVGSGGFTLVWNGFGLKVDDGKQYSLNLDGPGGIRVSGGQFFAKAFMQKEGDPLLIPLKAGDEFFLEGVGASGQIKLNPKDLNTNLYYPNTNFKIAITSDAMTWGFSQGQIAAVKNFTGKVIFEKTNADLGVNIKVSPNGDPTVALAAGGHLSLPEYGLYFQITQGDFKPTGKKLVNRPIDFGGPYMVTTDAVFQLSGVITFKTKTLPQLESIAVPVTNVSLNSDGFFGDRDTKAPPVKIQIGQVDVDLKRFVFLVQYCDLPSSGHQYLALKGQIRISNDFPLIDYYEKGMRIGPTTSSTQLAPNGSGEFVSFNADGAEGIPDFGDIKVKQNLGFATLDFTLNTNEIEFGGKTVSCLYGKGSLAMGGDGAGGFTMFVANGSWLVFGNVDLGDAAIPLGNSSLKLYAFRGGLGHNINVKPGVLTPGKQAGDLPINSFVSAPGNFLFQAGIGITTSDNYLAWGDAMLTVTTSPLTMSVGLSVNIFEQRSPNPSGDRTATGSLAITTNSFTAQLAADLNFPTRNLRLAAISGSTEFYVGPGDRHLYIGWPDRSAGVSFLNGALSLQGGMGFDVKNNEISFGTGLIWRENFLGIVQGQLDGFLYVAVKPADDLPSLTVAGQLHVFGEVDFYLFSVSAEAWLGGQLTTSPFELHAYGRIEGCIGTPFGDACDSIGFDLTYP